jgi:hypothetical protein
MTTAETKRARSGPDAMTLFEHLAELRRRIIVCAIAFTAAAIVGYIEYGRVLTFLRHPLCGADPPLHALRHRSSRGLRRAPRRRRLRRARSCLPGDLVPALEVRDPGAKGQREALRDSLRRRDAGALRHGVTIAWFTFPHALGFLRAALALASRRSSRRRSTSTAARPDGAFRAHLRVPGRARRARARGVISTAQLRKFRRIAIIIIVIASGVLTPRLTPSRCWRWRPDAGLLRDVDHHRPTDEAVNAPAKAVRARFVEELGFELDPFQIEAFDALDEGASVLVAAPTGSGKTLVAEYAVAQTLERRTADLLHDAAQGTVEPEVRRLRRDVRLGPGRAAHRRRQPEPGGRHRRDDDRGAPQHDLLPPGRLGELGCVVLDEVHYLEDRYRGSVWEEIILSAPKDVALVCLSATVANAEELAAWMTGVRGEVTPIIEDRRPIELRQLYVVEDRREGELAVLPTFVNGQPNRRALELDGRREQLDRVRALAARRQGSKPLGGSLRPRRSDVVEDFARAELLPAIYFVFSRNGCEEAVRQCTDTGSDSPPPRSEPRSARSPTATSSAERRRPQVAQLHAVSRRRRSGDRRAPRGARPAVSRGRRGALLQGAREGRLRHRDARARHQHAGQIGHHRGALEVRRGRPRGPDARRVHPAHRAGRASGHRRRRLRRGAVLAVSQLRGRRRARRLSHRAAHELVPADREHGGQPRPPPSQGGRLPARALLVRAVPEPTPLTDELDDILELLEEREYVEGWRLTSAGERLCGIYHDCDLSSPRRSARASSTASTPRAGGDRLDVHLRVPPRPDAPRPANEPPGAPRRGAARARRRASKDRAPPRPATDPSARPGLRCARLRLGAGRGPHLDPEAGARRPAAPRRAGARDVRR